MSFVGQDVFVQDYQAALLQSGAVQIAPDADNLFRLRNGIDRSWEYVDCARLLTDPEFNRPYNEMLGSYLLANFSVDSTSTC